MLESQSVSPISGLNEELDTKYLDVAPDDDSKLSRLTRFIADEVGKVLKPRQILISRRHAACRSRMTVRRRVLQQRYTHHRRSDFC